MATINEIIQSAVDRVKLKGSETWIKWSFWTRAKDVELNSGKNVETAVSELDENISNEIDRATDRENEIETALNSEITRAKSAESTLSTSINNEITRAKNAENTLETNKVPITRTINGKALSSDITLSASDVGADASGSANTALTNAKAYTDTKVADLVGTAPETLDTLEELADALKDNADIVDVLNESIATKANASDLTSHTGNTTVHITSTERTNWNDANSKKHTHSNKTVLDNTTASYTTADKTKLDGIATSAEVNQNAFSNVVVGSTTISADSKTDSLTLAGSNVTITPDATNDKVTIGITKANVTAALGYTPPTTDTVYTHPTTSGNKHIPSGGSSGQILRWSADGTAVWGADNSVTEAEVSTLNEVLTARMDSFTKLEEGSTTGDAELVDARIDYKGTTYENVGAHIREATSQLSNENAELKGDLGEKANQYFVNDFVRTSRSNNLLCYQSNVHDSELSSIDGSVISNQTGYCSSDFIPIGYEQIVMFSHSNAQTYIMTQVCTYSLNKTFIRKVKDVDNITLTANEYFIKVCFKQNDERVVQISLNERYDYENYHNIIETVNKKTGKKWCAVGDSLTDPWYDVYASFVADKLGMILTNRGIGGTCVAQNNNATVINAFVDRIPTYTDYYDVWSIYGGENDAANNTPIGDISSMDKTTFYGAYNVILGDLLTRTNRPTVILITPYQTKHNVKPYRDAVIKIGELYGLPVIDLYANSGINIYTRPYYLRDDVHPNQNGVNKLRPYILRKFSELCLPEITPTMPN